ncbi:MAG TPA: PKD domain-containing protein [Tepidisphaeraceae bacterium]|nr:PKD domain-containing protein [Tepidisphaeraceae bacterium]
MSLPAGQMSPVVSVTNTLNESTNTLSTAVTPAKTVTVKGNNGGVSTAPTPVIVVLGGSGNEPHSVFVHALDSTLGAGTPLTARYQWDFGDKPGTQYNDLVGWDAAHTYNTPGTYTITLTLTNQLGKTRILKTSVVIGANSYRDVYVDSVSGNDRNNGATTGTPVKTVARALALMGNNTQMLFKAGETFNVYSSINLPYQNVRVASYGSGAAPVLMRQLGVGTSILGMLPSSANVMIEGLTFNSPWSSTSLTAPKMPADGIFPAGTDITIRNCTFLNLDDAINGSRNPQGTLVENCTAPLLTGLRGCFIWGQGTDQVYLGNYVANSTQEHNIRTVWTVRQLIAYNNLTNLDRPTAVKGITTSKGTIDVHRGAYAYVSDNWVYDGELRVGPRDGPATVPGDITQFAVIEGNHTFDHSVEIYPGTYHVMFRNNIFTEPNMACVAITPRNAPGSNIQDITFANNTGITSTVGGQFFNITAGGAAGQLTLENNLWLAPNVVPGQHGVGGVYILDSGPQILKASDDNVWTMPKSFNSYAAGGINYVYPTWAPPHGYYTPAAWDALKFVSNDRFSQTAVTSNYTPVAGSVAATAGIPVPGVLVDINGKVRPIASGHISAGALQT